jgi:hypothetical protein
MLDTNFTHTGVTIRQLQPFDFDEVNALITDAFRHEPLGVRTHCSAPRIASFVHTMLPYMANGLSVVAMVDGSYAGAFLCVDEARKPLPPNLLDAYVQSSDYGPILAILEAADALLWKDESGRPRINPSDGIAHMWMGAVAEPFRRLGLHLRMSEEVVKLCQQRQIRYVVRECTGCYSKRNAEKQGFVSLGCVNYDTFEFRGAFPFRLDPAQSYAIDTSMHEGVHLMLLEIPVDRS